MVELAEVVAAFVVLADVVPPVVTASLVLTLEVDRTEVVELAARVLVELVARFVEVELEVVARVVVVVEAEVAVVEASMLANSCPPPPPRLLGAERTRATMTQRRSTRAAARAFI